MDFVPLDLAIVIIFDSEYGFGHNGFNSIWNWGHLVDMIGVEA